MKRTAILLFLAVAAGLLALSGCAQSASAPEVAVTAPAISLDITGDTCPGIEVAAGTQVAWTNRDTAAHIVRHEPEGGGEATFDSGELAPGDSFVFTFIEPGLYPYRCTEGSATLGTVTVSE